MRAADTARLAAEALGVEPEDEDVLGDGFERDDALELVRRHDDDARVLVVGHEPSFCRSSTTSPAGASTSRRARSPRSASTAAAHELIVLLRPRELESLAITRD